MRRCILFAFFINIYLYAPSQSFNNYWLLGYGSQWGLPFGGTDLIFANASLASINYHNREMSFHEECASISDSNGNLLFYTNGAYIANALDDTMMNGSGLNPSAYTTFWADDGLRVVQGALIIPKPGDSSKYYLFHETSEPITTPFGNTHLPRELLYSEIDMALDSGRGAVTSKNNILITGDTLISGQIGGIKHANGRDWWIVIHECYGNKFFIFLVTPQGISGPFIQAIGHDFVWGGGQISISPDGQWYARFNAGDFLDLFNFDRCSGTFSNWINIPAIDSTMYGGCAFAPNSQYLYITNKMYIYQFDVTAANITASKDTVAVWDGYYSPSPPFACRFYLAGLAADNKIYANSASSVVDLHVINYPDSLGSACDVQQHAIPLPTFNAYTMPNYPNYFLGPVAGSICDSLTGINDKKDKVNYNLRINPNPAQNMFYLNYSLPTGINADLYVYNTLGAEVMRKKLYWYFGYLQIDARELKNGVYFLKVQTARGSASGKVVIAR